MHRWASQGRQVASVGVSKVASVGVSRKAGCVGGRVQVASVGVSRRAGCVGGRVQGCIGGRVVIPRSPEEKGYHIKA